jgi:O-antigen/teichoic acid export membrane protein
VKGRLNYIKHRQKQFFADSLYRNSIYLLLNMAITSFSGFLFWAICTRLYSQTEVGYGTALIAALGLAVSLSNLGLNRTIVRFFHNHKSRQKYLSTVITIAALSSLMVSILMTLFLKRFGLSHVTIATIFIFVSGSLISSMKNIFDNIFIALKSASSMLYENTAFSIAKLIFIFPLMNYGFLGIFSAQMIGAMMAIIISIYLLNRRHRLKATMIASVSTMHGKWHFALGSYVTDIVGSLPNNLLPIIIVAKLGPKSGAIWYVSMQIANVLFMICSSINQSLFAEASADEQKLFGYVRKTSLLMISIIVPLVAVLMIFSNPILKLFGDQYLAGVNIIRILIASSILVMANYISGSVLVIMKKIKYLLIVNTVNAVIVISLTIFFSHSLVDIGWFWVIGEIVNVILFTVGAVWFSKIETNRTINRRLSA